MDLVRQLDTSGSLNYLMHHEENGTEIACDLCRCAAQRVMLTPMRIAPLV